MPQGDDYEDFLRNSLNKADLISRFNDYIQKDEVRSQMVWPVVATLEKETREITSTDIKHLFTCNHEEADTRVLYHCTFFYAFLSRDDDNPRRVN